MYSAFIVYCLYCFKIKQRNSKNTSKKGKNINVIRHPGPHTESPSIAQGHPKVSPFCSATKTWNRTVTMTLENKMGGKKGCGIHCYIRLVYSGVILIILRVYDPLIIGNYTSPKLASYNISTLPGQQWDQTGVDNRISGRYARPTNQPSREFVPR